MRKQLIIVALAFVAGAAQAKTVATGDPAAFSAALVSMGYKPGAIDPNGGSPLFSFPVNDFPSVAAFGSCTEGKNCKYLVLVSRFTDIKSPPSDWLNARNAELDLGKAWIGTDGTVSFSMPVPTGGEPITLPMLQFMLDQWKGVIGSLSRSAIDAKLVK